MTLSEDLKWRGLIKDKTFADDKWLDKPKTFYLGIDPSADSLTIGNLAIIILCRRLVNAGWTAVMVMGGGTSLVGDPGGKTEERQPISREAVINNIKGVRQQVAQLLSGEKFTMLDNHDWLAELKYVDFLREVGKHFSMTELMQRDFVNERMGKSGSGISYAEFSYSLVQGYDFWHLFKQHDVTVQVGGSDQWGNLLSGVALIRKKEGKEAHAFTIPLVVDTQSGKKFGKSESGAIWLDPSKTSPEDFYQFWVNVGDESATDFLKIFTELSKDEIGKVIKDFEANKSARLAQKTLAYAVTKLVHGTSAADKAKQHAEGLSGTSQSGAGSIRPGDSIVEALVKFDLAGSKTEARQLLESGGIYINNQKTNRQSFEETDFQADKIILRRGKTLRNTVVLSRK